jgi:hypothetical protein
LRFCFCAKKERKKDSFLSPIYRSWFRYWKAATMW